MISKEELEWALQQLEAVGYIRVTKDREKLYLTEEGTNRANDLLETIFRVDERVLVIMRCGDIAKEWLE